MTPTGAALEQSVRTFVGRLLETMQGIPDDDLNTWKPAAATEGSHEMNTFAAIAVHTVSAAEFHALHMVGRQPTDRVREAEFSATTTCAELERRFAAFLDAFHTLLDGMTDADFGADALREEDQPERTNAGWLMHTLDHIALHTGHLQIQRQLWEYETGRRGA
jgi:hypothetical protein